MRSIVEQQDRLAELEARLHQCDDEEGIQLNLSSRRQDGNNKRRELMKEVQETLKQYGMKYCPSYSDLMTEAG